MSRQRGGPHPASSPRRPRALVALGLLVAACGPSGDAMEPTPSVEARVEHLLDRMTLEEKVGQTLQADVRRVSPDDVRRYHLGSVLNGGGGFPDDDKHAGVEAWLALADEMWAASTDTTGGRTGIPIIWGVDAVHGHNNVVGATLFPHNIGLGAARHPELIRRIGAATAREMRVTGQDWNFGPTLAVPRNDRWGRTYEGYAEDPGIVRDYARAMVLGLQGHPDSASFLDDDHVIATAKHFVGDGATRDGRDQGDAVGDPAELLSLHAAAYTDALDAGVQAVMASFSSLNGVKMHAHRALLTDTLKGTMGFDGLLVGDWNGHGQVPGCSNASCATSVNAGLDMFMVPEDWEALYRNTLAQVRDGTISLERLDDAVRRILRVKIRAGVLDRERPSARHLAGDENVLGAPEHRALARQAVRESLVLLKNDGNVLPLRPDQHVLVVGDGADDIGKQTGGWTLTWQGTGNERRDFPGATSIWEGIRGAVDAAGGRATLSPDGSFDPADPPDVVVAVFGEDPYAEFQGDREDVDYPRGDGSELEMLRRIRRTGVPLVSVFLSGRPLWVAPELNASDAFVAAWLPGSEGGGVADVLFTAPDGTVPHDLRGRLSFSWPRAPQQVAVNVGDAAYDPLFEFGYGLSYADTVDVPVLPEATPHLGSNSGARILFGAGPTPPWRLLVSGAEGEEVPALTGRTTASGGEVVVTTEDRNRQEDARRVEWSGSGVGRVFLATLDGVDLSGSPDGVLAFDLRVETDAGGLPHLMVRMAGGDEVRLGLHPFVGRPAEGGWTPVRVPLRCLEAVGADLGTVAVPWGLEAGGASVVLFSDVRVEPTGGGSLACG